MESTTNTSEILLWLVAALIGGGMLFVLTLGWLKGNQWQREMKMRKRHSHR